VALKHHRESQELILVADVPKLQILRGLYRINKSQLL